MTLVEQTPSLIVKQLYDRESGTFTYLLIDAISREGAIIDPVREQFDRDMQIINELGVELLYSIETHAHADHVTAAGKIRQLTGARLVFGEACGIQAIDIAIKDGEELSLGHFKIRALATPGHTAACTSYYVDGKVFTGDTLLIRGCGRTDFQDGDPAKLFDSISSRLFALDDDTIVYPAHDYNGRMSSTIGEEKRWNPRVGNNRSKQDFINLMNDLNLDMPRHINEAVPANMNVGVNFDPRRYLFYDFSMQDLHKVWSSQPENTLIMDNRTPEEYARGHVPGSRNIPLGTENSQLETLKQFQQVYIYCRSGRRAQTSCTNLNLQGLENITCIAHGGMPGWIDAGYQVEK